MPLTVSNYTGDGVVSAGIATSIQLPDSGSSVQITGSVDTVTGAAVAVTGSPLTAPTPPGSGSVFWIIQVDGVTGVASVKQSTVSIPAADTGGVVVFTQTLTPSSANLALVSTTSTPDTY